MTLTTKPFGYRVTIQRAGEAAPHVFGSRGPSQADARYRAEKKSAFVSLLRLEPLSESEFQRSFPPERSPKRGPRFLRNCSA